MNKICYSTFTVSGLIPKSFQRQTQRAHVLDLKYSLHFRILNIIRNGFLDKGPIFSRHSVRPVVLFESLLKYLKLFNESRRLKTCFLISCINKLATVEIELAGWELQIQTNLFSISQVVQELCLNKVNSNHTQYFLLQTSFKVLLAQIEAVHC